MAVTNGGERKRTASVAVTNGGERKRTASVAEVSPAGPTKKRVSCLLQTFAVD